MATFRVELPEELLETAKVSLDRASQDVAMLVALELFREHAVSLGKAAELSNVSIEEFMAFASLREVPLHYTLEDLESDRETLKSLAS